MGDAYIMVQIGIGGLIMQAMNFQIYKNFNIGKNSQFCVKLFCVNLKILPFLVL